MASWIYSILSSLSLPVSSAKRSAGDVYSWLQPLVKNFQPYVLSWCWIEPFLILSGMFVFWTLQTVCFALYSRTGSTIAAHTVIAMICTWTPCPSLSSIMTLIFRCTIEVLFYGFCEYILPFFFCSSLVILIQILQMMYVSFNHLWTLFSDFTMIHFRSLSRLWSWRMF